MIKDPPRFLLVDDDESVREMCVRMLSMEGYKIDTAESAEEID